jgi:hypothetical protein
LAVATCLNKLKFSISGTGDVDLPQQGAGDLLTRSYVQRLTG